MKMNVKMKSITKTPLEKPTRWTVTAINKTMSADDETQAFTKFVKS